MKNTHNTISKLFGIGSDFPLYLFFETTAQQSLEAAPLRTPNLKPEIVNQMAEKLGLTFVPDRNSPPLEGCLQGGVVHSPLSPTHKPIKINNTLLQRNFVENLPFNPRPKQLASDKRKEGILSEVLFWQQVHKGKFHDIDFDRQRIIGNYIVDFYVKTLGLIIEIDGSSHDHKEAYDRERQDYLESLGLKMYRIKDLDVKRNLGQVMRDLEGYMLLNYAMGATPVFDHPCRGGELTQDHQSSRGQLTPDHYSREGKLAPAHHSNRGELASEHHARERLAPDHHSNRGEFAPIDVLDYIYAVLHSPTYREKYKEFLKIDFPRVPYPKDADTFWKLVKLGGEIRQIHLLESSTVEQYITQYPVDGDHIISRKITKSSRGYEADNATHGKVYINDEQYFDNVPLVAWEFYIGGYQPAQKWLKDRKNRTLEFDDILHYQKIIVALSETDRLMKEIDGIKIE